LPQGHRRVGPAPRATVAGCHNGVGHVVLTPGRCWLVAEERREMAQRGVSFPALRLFERVPQKYAVTAETRNEALDVARVERPGIACNHLANSELIGNGKRACHRHVTR